MPFRTKFGYHIIQVNDVRKNRGQVEVAHIMIKNDKVNSKKEIDSIYQILLAKKMDFYSLAKKVSEDRASAVNGGKLQKFGTGKMIEGFANVAFSLKNENDISKPFKTKYGWHIIKLIKKYPIESFDNMESKLVEKVKKSSRYGSVNNFLNKKLAKLFKVTIDSMALGQFSKEDFKANPNNFNKDLFKIEGENYTQKDFGIFLAKHKSNNITLLFNKFKQLKLVDYYKSYLEKNNQEFIKMFSNFKDGMLLFDLLELKVWNKSKDSLGLANYYNNWKRKKYQNKSLKDNRGIIISDYQNYLENKLMEKLHATYKVVMNKKEEKRVLKMNF